MRRINILFVMLQMEMGGAERMVYDLALNIDRTLFNPSVAWFFGNKTLKEFEDLNIQLYHIPKRKRIDFHAMQSLGEVITKNDIQLVNAHHFMSLVYSFYGSKIRNRARLVYTEHSEWEIEKIPWKWKRIGRHLMNRADAAVGVSGQVTRRIQENFKTDQSKTFIIQNGVNLENFTNGDSKMSLKEKIGLSQHDKVIGIVANFRRVKNHIFLLRAFSELIKECASAKLLLIGQGFKFDPENSEQEIRNFVDKNNLSKNVFFLGYRSDIPDLLSIIDVFCLTSFKEGLPVSLIEAMAAGLPIVGTDVEGIRDVIIPNNNGFLVSVDDVGRLKEVFLLLLKDESLCRKMGEQSQALATNTYSIDRCITQYQNLFMHLLDQQHGNNDVIL